MISRTSVAIAFALALAPFSASAQLFDWGQQCMPTLPQSCMSIRLAVEYTESLEVFGGNAATTFQLWVQNIGGGSFGFRNFRVENAAYTPDPNGFGWSLLSQDPCMGCSEHDLGGADTESWGHWAINGWPTDFGAPSFGFARHFYQAVFGCDVPDAYRPELGGVATTCGGLVRVDGFFLPGRWAITPESRFQIGAGSYNSVNVTQLDGGGVLRDWNWDAVDCYIGESCVSVPEPSALLLLLTGLIGLSVLRRLRRCSELG